MGIERRVDFPREMQFSWESFFEILQKSGETPIVRMIDGLPAFPEEMPSETWSDVRISLRGGMITLRRQESPPTIRCVAWGTSDASLLASLEVATMAVAQAGNGEVHEVNP